VVEMNTRELHIVVGGHRAVAQALSDTNLFASVLAVESTSELRDAIVSNSFPKDKSQTMFLFSDALPVNTEQDLEQLVGGLCRRGFAVILLAVTDAALAIVQRNPSAGLFDGSYTVNTLLAAISGMGLGTIPPLPNGHDPIGSTKASLYPIEERIEPLLPAAATGWKAPPGQLPSTRQPAASVNTPPASSPATPAATPPPAAPAQTQGAWKPATTTNDKPSPATAPTSAPTVASTSVPAPAATFTRPATATDEPATPRPGLARAAFTGGTGNQNGSAPYDAPPPAASGRVLTRPAPATQTREEFTVGGSVDGGPGISGRAGIARPQTGGRGGLGAIATHQDYAPQTRGRRRGHVIVVTSPKGGTGKSSVSINASVYLGLALAGSGQRVCLVDANFQQPDVGKLLNQYSPNIGNLMRDQAAITPERIEEYLIERPKWNTSFLLGPATPRDASPVYFNSQLYQRVLDALRQRFDYIVIDTPVAEVYHDILRGFALPEADYIIVPIVPALHTLMNADDWLRIITSPQHAGGDGINPEKIGIVLNQEQSGIGCDEEQVRRELYGWNFIGSIPATKEWLRCVNEGELIATKNYIEINEPFASILANATGLDELAAIAAPSQDRNPSGGLKGLLRRRKK
jgi:septum formation inhibitor-activating ATPase MinD